MVGVQSDPMGGVVSALHIVIKVAGAVVDDEMVKPPRGSKVGFPQPWDDRAGGGSRGAAYSAPPERLEYSLSHRRQHCVGKLRGSGGAAHVSRQSLTLGENRLECLVHSIGGRAFIQVPQHQHG